MKITDYPSIQELEENNIFLVDGPGGTKQLTAKDLAVSLTKLISMDRETYLNILDEFASVEDRRTTFGGRNLGDTLTKEQAQNIVNGTFKGFFVGDYWEKDDRIWRIVDIDYWLGTGDSEDKLCKEHHLVIFPDDILYKTTMNPTESTDGGYYSSIMYKTGLNQAKTIVNEIFHSNDILNHRDIISNAVTEHCVTGIAFVDITIDLPYEYMLFGSLRYQVGLTPSNTSANITRLVTSPLSLFTISPDFIKCGVEYWLREPSTKGWFTISSSTSISTTRRVANNANVGVRPVFGITGAETAAS